jgi:hypothetical protein
MRKIHSILTIVLVITLGISAPGVINGEETE